VRFGIGLLYIEAQQGAKVAQTTLTYILTVHRNEEIPVPDVSGFRRDLLRQPLSIIIQWN